MGRSIKAMEKNRFFLRKIGNFETGSLILLGAGDLPALHLALHTPGRTKGMMVKFGRILQIRLVRDQAAIQHRTVCGHVLPLGLLFGVFQLGTCIPPPL